MINSQRCVYALALGMLGACGSDSPSGIERITAHVSPLQTLSIEGLAPAGTRDGFVRFEADHFAYEVPVTTTHPLSVTAPLFITEDGSPGSGVVHVYWLPTASDTSVSLINAQMPAPTLRSDAVDLNLDVAVDDLPRFAYAAQPGVLLRAFTAGTLAALSGTYDALFSSGVDASLAADYQQQRMASQTALTQALAAIDRIRMNPANERLAPVIVPGGSVDASLSLDSLRLADRVVGAFLIAERKGAWTAPAKPTGARDANASVAVLGAPLSADLESDATGWLPNMADEAAMSVLERAGHLASFVAHTTKAASLAGALGNDSGTATNTAAITGGFTLSALTSAPAATATVIRAAGNALRGGGTLTSVQYATFAPGIQYVISQNLGPGLADLQDGVRNWVGTSSAVVNSLGTAISTLSDWTHTESDTPASWLIDCVHTPANCFLADDAMPLTATDPSGQSTDGISPCDQTQLSGSDIPETRTFEIGSACADLSLEYDTNSVADSITVRYEGIIIAATGCTATQSILPIHICGSSSQLEVSVTPNCAGGTDTSWSFILVCPAPQ